MPSLGLAVAYSLNSSRASPEISSCLNMSGGNGEKQSKKAARLHPTEIFVFYRFYVALI